MRNKPDTCLYCNSPMLATYRTKKYCSAKCRVAYNRLAKVGILPPDPDEVIRNQIAALKAETIPRRMDNTLGRKIWVEEQRKKIAALEGLLKW